VVCNRKADKKGTNDSVLCCAFVFIIVIIIIVVVIVVLLVDIAQHVQTREFGDL